MGEKLTPNRSQAGFALVFRAGERPSASDVEAALAGTADEFGPMHVSYRPPVSDGWIELLASGLTFDLAGLSPGPAIPAPGTLHHFGVAEGAGGAGAHALMLSPGPHLHGASSMLPVVRVASGMVARLVRELPVARVCWLPASTAMAPDYFLGIVSRWLGGGTFPALGLTALTPDPDGNVESSGLGFFIGKELSLQALNGESIKQTSILALRLIDLLVSEGGGDDALGRVGEVGMGLHAEMSTDGRRIIVKRGP